MATDLRPVSERLRSILELYGRRLHLTTDGDGTCGVDLAPEGERNPRTWFGGVRLASATSATT